MLSAASADAPVRALVHAIRCEALPAIRQDSLGVAEWLASAACMDGPTVDLVADHGIDGAALRQASEARPDWPEDSVRVAEAAGGLGAMSHGDFSAYDAAATALASRCPQELASALASRPVTLFLGDALVVDGRLGRFAGFTITGCRLDVRDIRSPHDQADGFPLSLGSWGRDTVVRVIEEDCLGHCYAGIARAKGAPLPAWCA